MQGYLFESLVILKGLFTNERYKKIVCVFESLVILKGLFTA